MNNDYDVVIVGSGLSGLQCAHSLRKKHALDKDKILLIEAQDYIGGRIKQSTDFVPGCKIDLGAEFIHGDNSMLNEFAEDTDQPLESLFCWAHGDGGPSEAPIGDGYGLYFISGDETKPSRLLRFDDKSTDFKTLNRNLWDLSYVDLDSISDSLSVHDYLTEFGTNDDMMALAAAGFANTMACNLEELSLKQCVHWAKEEHYDKTHSSNPNSPTSCSNIFYREDKLRSGSITEKVGHSDYRFKSSYSCLVDYLKDGFNILLNTPISIIDHSNTGDKNIILHAANGKTFSAKRVVVTCSTHVLKNPQMLRFQPSLPVDKVEALDCVAMYTATKVILTFTAPAWPKGLHGMIMTGTIVPEVWFKSEKPSSVSKKPADREVTDDTSVETATSSDDDSDSDLATVYMAVGFLSARFADEAKAYSHEELIQKFLSQLDHVFCHLGSEHLSAFEGCKNAEQTGAATCSDLKRPPAPSSVFVKGLVYDWATNHPYIGGAYASPMAGKSTSYASVLARPVNNRLFFAGEATNEDAGACTHSALETGVRAADEIAASLKGVELSS